MPACFTNTMIFVLTTIWLGKCFDPLTVFSGPSIVTGARVFFTPVILTFLMVFFGF